MLFWELKTYFLSTPRSPPSSIPVSIKKRESQKKKNQKKLFWMMHGAGKEQYKHRVQELTSSGCLRLEEQLTFL